MYQLRILKLATSPTDFQSPNQVPMLSLKPVLINFIAQKLGKQLPYILSFSHSSSSIRDKQSANNTTQRPLHLRKVRSLLSVLFCSVLLANTLWFIPITVGMNQHTRTHRKKEREFSLCGRYCRRRGRTDPATRGSRRGFPTVASVTRTEHRGTCTRGNRVTSGQTRERSRPLSLPLPAHGIFLSLSYTIPTCAGMWYAVRRIGHRDGLWIYSISKRLLHQVNNWNEWNARCKSTC